MKISDFIPLGDGVYRLGRGYRKWDPDQCESVVIAFAGIEAMLDVQKFKADQEVDLPSPLKDSLLKTLDVHYEGWYVASASKSVEMLAPAIFNYLPDMLVGEKVMLLDNDEEKQEGRTYVVKLISVHTEARIKLSPYEKSLLDAVRDVKPRKKADWIEVVAELVQNSWQEISEKFECEPGSTSAVAQGIEASNTSEITGSLNSSTTTSSTPVIDYLKTTVLGPRSKEKSDLESNIPSEDTPTHRHTISESIANENLDLRGHNETSVSRRKRWTVHLE